MYEYKFVTFGEPEDKESNELINAVVQEGYEVVSHSTDKYWGLTVIFKKIR